jgi:endonuclease/exonuclease/phosphatase family metal-dependent hydrolase
MSRNRGSRTKGVLAILLVLLSGAIVGVLVVPPPATEPVERVEPGTDREAVPGQLTLATWNVRFLSNGSRTDEELAHIADVIERYDLVAVQELRDGLVVERLLDMLPGFEALVSEPVGRGQLERYAYFYRTEIVEVLGIPYLVPDPADAFIREPYVAHFRAGETDFTLITIHVIYGDTVAGRRAEIRLLDDVIELADTANGPEADLILTGDFNRSAGDEAWELGGWSFLVPPETPTTIGEASSYDNVWYDASVTPGLSLLEVYPFDELVFGGDDDAASLAVSDHRPVAALMELLPDDDAEGSWEAAP